MTDVYDAIVQAANKYGVPVETMLGIAKLESNFNPSADNPVSTASGLFQFTDGTAGDYGLSGDNRNGVRAQAEAAAKMAANNTRSLTATLGRNPTSGEVYLAHQQGLGGARALLRNPDKSALEVLTGVYGSEARARQALSGNGGNADMTASQFSNQWVSKGDRSARLFPPGEIPNMVGTDLSTARTPPPIPPRRPDTIVSALRKPTSAGDGLALNPVTRGQTAPMFDGEYSALNQGMMRMPAPEATWGMNQERTPYPALPSPQMAGLRATRPDTQLAANQAAEQMRSRANIGQPPVTRSVPSVPVPVQTAQARLPELSPPFSGVPLPQPRPDTSRLVATIPTTQPAIARGTSSVMDNYAFNTLPGMPRIDANAPDRLMASAGLPELFGNGGVNGIGGNAVAPMPFSRPSFLNLPSMPTAPMPFARPNQRTAPMPMPANMRPQARAPIFLAQPQRRAVPMPTPQQQRAAVVNNGNGGGSQNSQPSVVNGHSASGGVRYDPDSGDWVRA